MPGFRGKRNCYLRIKCIRYAIDGVECQSLPAFNFGNGCATDPYPVSNLSLSYTQLSPSLSEKFSNITKFICHLRNLSQRYKMFPI